MILKLIGIVSILISCISIGDFYVDRARDRLKLLKEFRKMCMLWKGVVRHSGQDLSEAMINISTKLEVRLKELLNLVIIEMKKMDGKLFNVIWKDVVEEKLKNENLKETDKDIVLKIGDTLGYLDKELQIENFEQYICDLDNIIRELEKEIAEKKKLYKTVSVMMAVFIVIIFLN